MASPVNTIDAVESGKNEKGIKVRRYANSPQPIHIIPDYAFVERSNYADLETVIMKLECVVEKLSRPKGWIKENFIREVKSEFLGYCVVGALQDCIVPYNKTGSGGYVEFSWEANDDQRRQQYIGRGLLNACIPIDAWFNKTGGIKGHMDCMTFNDDGNTKKVMILGMVRRAIKLANKLLAEKADNGSRSPTTTTV